MTAAPGMLNSYGIRNGTILITAQDSVPVHAVMRASYHPTQLWKSFVVT